MTRTIFRFVVAVALLTVGWSVGRAQTPTPPTPDFEISVVGPQGTKITCVRGCLFEWSGTEASTGETIHGQIKFATVHCRNAVGPTCEQRVGGFLDR
jgi:hypothetical protein